jgi:curved DNA-binding protein CbpA
MAGDLYALLGVARDADAAAIRRAYRTAAKRAHPDGGGKREDFDALKFAYECLADPDRRKHYDATGDAGRAEVDNLDANALQHAFAAIGNLITLHESQGRDTAHVDIYGEAAKELGRKAQEFEKQLKTLRKQVEKCRSLAARSRAKRDSDRIAPMFEAQARAIDEGVRQNEAVKRQIERAIEILGEHEFRFDKEQRRTSQQQFAGGFFQVGVG